jgi:N-acetylglucosaminyldiphosphoundecaprenol N-acetyl-beta-D-mannosaminyltransferase
MYGHELGVPVMIGIGGTLDFIAGNTKRAPDWMQRTGFEWLYRLLQEPRRLWKRYAVDLVHFGSFFLKQWWAMRQGNVPTAVLPETDLLLVEGKAVLNLHGKLTVEDYEEFNAVAQQALANTSQIIVNLTHAEFLDSSIMGALVGLAKQARDNGGEVLLAAVPPIIMQTLSLLRLDQFFVIVEDTNSGMVYENVAEETAVSPPPASELAYTSPSYHQAQKTAVNVLESEWVIVKGPRRLDALTAPELETHCTEILADNPHLVLDLSDTVLLASAGLAVLAKVTRLANEQNGELRVTNCSEDVLRVINIVRFDKVLSLYNDVDAAVNDS